MPNPTPPELWDIYDCNRCKTGATIAHFGQPGQTLAMVTGASDSIRPNGAGGITLTQRSNPETPKEAPPGLVAVPKASIFFSRR